MNLKSINQLKITLPEISGSNRYYKFLSFLDWSMSKFEFLFSALFLILLFFPVFNFSISHFTYISFDLIVTWAFVYILLMIAVNMAKAIIQRYLNFEIFEFDIFAMVMVCILTFLNLLPFMKSDSLQLSLFITNPGLSLPTASPFSSLIFMLALLTIYFLITTWRRHANFEKLQKIILMILLIASVVDPTSFASTIGRFSILIGLNIAYLLIEWIFEDKKFITLSLVSLLGAYIFTKLTNDQSLMTYWSALAIFILLPLTLIKSKFNSHKLFMLNTAMFSIGFIYFTLSHIGLGNLQFWITIWLTLVICGVALVVIYYKELDWKQKVSKEHMLENNKVRSLSLYFSAFAIATAIMVLSFIYSPYDSQVNPFKYFVADLGSQSLKWVGELNSGTPSTTYSLIAINYGIIGFVTFAIFNLIILFKHLQNTIRSKTLTTFGWGIFAFLIWLNIYMFIFVLSDFEFFLYWFVIAIMSLFKSFTVGHEVHHVAKIEPEFTNWYLKLLFEVGRVLGVMFVIWTTYRILL